MSCVAISNPSWWASIKTVISYDQAVTFGQLYQQPDLFHKLEGWRTENKTRLDQDQLQQFWPRILKNKRITEDDGSYLLSYFLRRSDGQQMAKEALV
eukprot:38846-Eustigmatos_ZCMA.PRE.1